MYCMLGCESMISDITNGSATTPQDIIHYWQLLFIKGTNEAHQPGRKVQ